MPASSVVPKMGPEPVLLSRKEVDALYETLDAVTAALKRLGVDYIVTGGSLLGAIRQHSILFCDDDIDIAIIDDYDYDHSGGDENDDNNNNNKSVYESIVVPNLQRELDKKYFTYQIRPWEGGDRIRPKRMSNVFLDLFVLRRYESIQDLKQVIGIKKNGQPQSDEYVNGIIDKMTKAAVTGSDCGNNNNNNDDDDDEELSSLNMCPFWHFSTRKAIEMWTKEVYRESELFPLTKNLKMGPLTGIYGPRMPVLLLKRAFGMDCFDVYYQSISHNNQQPSPQQSDDNNNDSNSNNNHHRTDPNDTGNLPPLTAAGGTWEGGQKAPLEEQHYLPMQPISRAARRNTLHCKEKLLDYLQEQSALETLWRRNDDAKKVNGNSNNKNNYNDNDNKLETHGSERLNNTATTSDNNHRPHRTVYMDGVFDLFHIGHLEAIRNCAKLGDRVIIGVTGDEDATGYKRKPIVPQSERVAIVQALQDVDEIVCPCPLVVTEQFMSDMCIDLVVHGFANDDDAKRQEEFFAIPMQLGKFQRISYYHGLSTTDRIRNIRQVQENGGKVCTANKDWFGSTVAAVTNNSATIPVDPFPLPLRMAIEMHIRKATKRREEALAAIRTATGRPGYDLVLTNFKKELARETDFAFDVAKHAIRPALLKSLELPSDFDLSRMHDEEEGRLKDKLLENFTKNHRSFQQTYDEFVRSVCAPQLAALCHDCDEFFYQAFPCLRIVQPDEFSIGPHSDVSYGHHPCSINFYVPLTEIGGASSLFLESRPGSEDWHSIEGDYGTVKRFPGAICLHWTTDNKTAKTRVSLDFRLIPGPMFHALKCGGSLSGGQIDVYRRSEGYYNRCIRKKLDSGVIIWERDGPLLTPDARVGFPWTVKNWDKFWSKQRRYAAAFRSS